MIIKDFYYTYRLIVYNYKVIRIIVSIVFYTSKEKSIYIIDIRVLDRVIR